MPLSGLGTKIQFTLTADDRDFNRTMKRGVKTASDQERAMRRLQQRLRSTSKTFTGITKNVLSFRTALGVAAGGGILGALAKSAIEAGAELKHLSDQTGLTVERFQTLRRVFENAGVAPTRFNRAMLSLNRTVGEAIRGSGEYAKVFQELGIQLVDIEGNVKNIDTIFDELVIATQNFSDPQRAAALGKLLGETGVRFNGLVKQGIDGIRQLEDAERKLGIVSDKTATDLEMLDTRMGQLRNAFLSAVQEGLGQNIEGIDKLIDELTESIPAATGGFITLGTVTSKVLLAAIENAGGLATIYGIGLARKAIPAAKDAMIAFGLASKAAWLNALGPIGLGVQALTGIVLFRDEIKEVLTALGAPENFDYVGEFSKDASEEVKKIVAELETLDDKISDSRRKIRGFEAGTLFHNEESYEVAIEKEKERLTELTAAYMKLREQVMKLSTPAATEPTVDKPEIQGLPTEEELTTANEFLKTAVEERTEVWSGYWEDLQRKARMERDDLEKELNKEVLIPSMRRPLTAEESAAAEILNMQMAMEQLRASLGTEPPPFIEKTEEGVNKLSEAFSDLGDFAGDALERIIIRGGDARDVMKSLIAVIATRFVNQLFEEGGLLRGERQHGGNILPGRSYKLHKDEIVTPIGAPMNVIPAGKANRGSQPSIVFAPVFNGVNGPEVESTFNRMRPRLLQDVEQLITNQQRRENRRNRIGASV